MHKMEQAGLAGGTSPGREGGGGLGVGPGPASAAQRVRRRTWTGAGGGLEGQRATCDRASGPAPEGTREPMLLQRGG